MEEENKEPNVDRPHVRIFGADVDSGGGASNTASADANASSSTNNDTATKEDWRAKKAAWRAERQANRDQWRAQRQDWRDSYHHGGGYFWGLILLLAGLMALSYTLGFISRSFWYAIAPFWPLLLILWGASVILGRHWFSRFVLFIFTIIFFAIVVFYGLVRTDSPLLNGVPPNVRSAVNSMYPQQ